MSLGAVKFKNMTRQVKFELPEWSDISNISKSRSVWVVGNKS